MTLEQANTSPLIVVTIDDALGGLRIPEFFSNVIELLVGEEIIKRSPRGQVAKNLLSSLQQVAASETIYDLLAKELFKCLRTKYVLPSNIYSHAWRAFHLRGKPAIKEAWNNFVHSNLDAAYQKEAELVLQLLLDRVFKMMISNLAAKRKHRVPSSLPPLTMQEKNAVRYMSGYIAVKLLKKYDRRCKNPELQKKWRIFADVLKSMKATQQPGEPDTFLEYTSLWSELIDRGGLYHISDQVFMLMESIESVTRKHLQTCESFSGANVAAIISQDVLADKEITTLWEKIASKYEKYSVELLTSVVNLWITITSYSFTKCWTMHFEKRYSKGVRKSLKQSE